MLVLRVSSKKKKKTSMMSGAGLVRFFEEVEAKVSISPYQLVFIAILFAVVVLVFGYLAPILVP